MASEGPPRVPKCFPGRAQGRPGTSQGVPWGPSGPSRKSQGGPRDVLGTSRGRPDATRDPPRAPSGTSNMPLGVLEQFGSEAKREAE